jgi:hypothetical protein
MPALTQINRCREAMCGLHIPRRAGSSGSARPLPVSVPPRVGRTKFLQTSKQLLDDAIGLPSSGPTAAELLSQWRVIRTSSVYVFRDPKPQLLSVPAPKSKKSCIGRRLQTQRVCFNSVLGHAATAIQQQVGNTLKLLVR